METAFQAFLIAITPIVVSLLTQLAKMAVPFILRISNKWVVFGVVVLSYLAAIGESALSGNPIDPVSVQALSDTVINTLAATGTYFFGAKFAGKTLS